MAQCNIFMFALYFQIGFLKIIFIFIIIIISHMHTCNVDCYDYSSFRIISKGTTAVNRWRQKTRVSGELGLISGDVQL